jgi:hypothetical protein
MQRLGVEKEKEKKRRKKKKEIFKQQLMIVMSRVIVLLDGEAARVISHTKQLGSSGVIGPELFLNCYRLLVCSPAILSIESDQISVLHYISRHHLLCWLVV